MCGEGCAKCVLIVFNTVFLLAGLGLLVVGGIVFMSKDQYEPIIGEAMFPAITYSILGSGAAVIIVAFAGCVGAITKSRKLLGVYLIFLMIVFLVEAAIGIIGFLYYDKVKELLDEHFKPAILTKYGQEGYTPITEAVDTLQGKLGCCGYTASTDWVVSKMWKTAAGTTGLPPVSKFPYSCCKVRGFECTNDYDNAWPMGCLPKVEDLIKNNLMIVAAVCLGVGLVQLAGIVCTMVLCKQSKEEEYDL